MSFRGGLLPGESCVITYHWILIEMFTDSRVGVEMMFKSDVDSRLAGQDMVVSRLLEWEIAHDDFYDDRYLIKTTWSVHPRWEIIGETGPEELHSTNMYPQFEISGEYASERFEMRTEYRPVRYEALSDDAERMVLAALGQETERSVKFKGPCPDCGEQCEWVAYSYPPVPGYCSCMDKKKGS